MKRLSDGSRHKGAIGAISPFRFNEMRYLRDKFRFGFEYLNLSAGPFLVIFFAEPTGLSTHNFTEPDGKTASPAKKQCWIKGYPSCVREGRGSDEIGLKTFGQE